IAHTLGHYQVVNCASRDYVARHGRPRTLAQLAKKHRMVHYVSTLGNPPDGFEYVDGDGIEQVIALRGAITVNNSAAYLTACLAGLGIIQVPVVGVRELLARG